MQKALAFETDLQTRAAMTVYLRRLYADYGKTDEAIATMETYIREGSEISTYLRDRKDDARMYVASQRALLGDRSTLPEMDRLVKQKPQNYNYAKDYADALAANGEYDQAISLVARAQRIFLANRNRRADFDLRMAEYYKAAGKVDSALMYYQFCKDAGKELTPTDLQRMHHLSLLLHPEASRH
jgi:tetratricopeptide (TPR) repeat protein